MPTVSKYVCALMLVATAASTSGAIPPIVDPPSGQWQPGTLVWADLLTDDVAGARRFYGAVFGWEFRDTDSSFYTEIRNAGMPLGGLVAHEPRDPAVSENQWLVSISVGDVDIAVDRVRAGGGKVLLAPEELPERGRHAVVEDPSGAALALVRAAGGDPRDRAPRTHDWIWAELWTRNVDDMSSFYESVVGYRRNDVAGYRVLESGGRSRAGVVELPWQDVMPNWLVYLLVEDVAATAALAERHGGSILLGPSPELEQGTLALIADPTGGVVAIQQRKAEQ